MPMVDAIVIPCPARCVNALDAPPRAIRSDARVLGRKRVASATGGPRPLRQNSRGSAPRFLPERATLPAIPLSMSIDVHVVHRQLVSAHARRFASVAGCGCLPAENVLATGNWFEVPRIQAAPISAQVVEFQAVGDGPNQDHIRRAMREVAMPPIVRRKARADLHIAVRLNSARPTPARVGPVISSKLSEPFIKSHPLQSRAHAYNLAF